MPRNRSVCGSRLTDAGWRVSRWAIVGYGAIGSRVAHLASAFGMRVLAVRRTPQPDELATVYGPDGLREVLANSDVLVVAAPASEETFQLIDAAALERMRPGAIFCNVARGSLVDEDALLAALQSGRLGAAILDVTAQEPLPGIQPALGRPESSAVTAQFGVDRRLRRVRSMTCSARTSSVS